MRGTFFLRLLGLAAVLLFIVAAFTPVPGRLTRHLAVTSQPGPAQAIVVLGAGVSTDGLLNSTSLRRALEGIVLHRRGLAPLLVLLGPVYRGTRPEAEVRADLARALGVASDAIVTVQGAWTTREEAQRVRTALAPRGVTRILLVTDSQHLVRAVPLFERQGFDVAPVAADDVSAAARKPEDRLDLSRRLAQEIVARAYHRLAGYL
jgi:uncharacterized SAM-binding protein YcdF (DUF218 family)